LLPAGAVAGWGLHPLESAALSRRTPQVVVRTSTWIIVLNWYAGAENWSAWILHRTASPGIVTTSCRILKTAKLNAKGTLLQREGWALIDHVR
jgi:hypothetical protein